jgi:YidC/Oxa1 family membrane protein insertase
VNPWNALVEFLGTSLAFFYSLAPNYGTAIILLTLAVSLLLFPLTLKQTRSMKAMQEIQPEVKRLQKEYKEDREEMQKQLMALYQERGVNPAAGCLPLILQMPIWFALFSVLRNPADTIPANSALADAVAADQTYFLGMNLQISPSDAASSGLVDAIPYIILVLIVMAAGFYQQYQTTRRSAKSGQQQQQPQGMQTALKIMPLFFGFISWGFPTGLVLYFATSNLFRIAQQSVILRMDDNDSKEPAVDTGTNGASSKQIAADTGGSNPSSAAPPRPPTSSPSPHASKKRKKRRRK